MFWARVVGMFGCDFVNDLVFYQDGVLVLGWMVEFGNFNVIDDVFLYYFEFDGIIGWSCYFGCIIGGDDEYVDVVFIIEFGNIVVVMYEAVGQDCLVYVMLLQDNGSFIWGIQFCYESLDWVFLVYGFEYVGWFWIVGVVFFVDGIEEVFWVMLNMVGQFLFWYFMMVMDNQFCSFCQIILLEEGCFLVGIVGVDIFDLLLVWVDENGNQVLIWCFYDFDGVNLLVAFGGY